MSSHIFYFLIPLVVLMIMMCFLYDRQATEQKNELGSNSIIDLIKTILEFLILLIPACLS